MLMDNQPTSNPNINPNPYQAPNQFQAPAPAPMPTPMPVPTPIQPAAAPKKSKLILILCIIAILILSAAVGVVVAITTTNTTPLPDNGSSSQQNDEKVGSCDTKPLETTNSYMDMDTSTIPDGYTYGALQTLGDYLCVEEWGVKVKIPDNISNLEYYYFDEPMHGQLIITAVTTKTGRVAGDDYLSQTVYTGLSRIEKMPSFAFTADDCDEVWDAGFSSCYIDVGTDDVIYEKDDYYFYVNSTAHTWPAQIMELMGEDEDAIEEVSTGADLVYDMLSNPRNWSNL